MAPWQQTDSQHATKLLIRHYLCHSFASCLRGAGRQLLGDGSLSLRHTLHRLSAMCCAPNWFKGRTHCIGFCSPAGLQAPCQGLAAAPQLPGLSVQKAPQAAV